MKPARPGVGNSPQQVASLQKYSETTQPQRGEQAQKHLRCLYKKVERQWAKTKSKISARLTKRCLGYTRGDFRREIVPQESSMGKAKLLEKRPGPIHRPKKRKSGKIKNLPHVEIQPTGVGGVSQ